MCRLAVGLLLILALPLLAATGYLPHVAADTASFDTEVVLENQSPDQQRLFLTAIDTAGNVIATQALDLDGQSRRVVSIAELFPDKAVAYLQYDTPPRTSAAIAFVPLANPSNRAVVAGSDRRARVWRLYPGSWVDTFDGLALVNTACGFEASVTITQYDATGAIHGQTTFFAPLPPAGKMVVNLANIFEPLPGNYLEVSASQPLSAMALKGTLDPSAKQAFLLGGNVEPRTDFPDLYQATLDNLAKWNNQESTRSYQLETRYLCFCSEDVIQPVTVTVADGVVQSMVYSQSGEPVPLALISRYLTVEQMFQLIFDTIESGVDSMSAEFDPETGAPLAINIDPSSCVADEEYSLRVLSVQQ